MPETVSQVQITNLTRRFDEFVKNDSEWKVDHDKSDDRRFGEMNASIALVDSKTQRLIEARAEQVGAAKAIAELAERRAAEQSEESAHRARLQSEKDAQRGRRQTWIMSAIMALMAFTTICIQKHWLGL